MFHASRLKSLLRRVSKSTRALSKRPAFRLSAVELLESRVTPAVTFDTSVAGTLAVNLSAASDAAVISQTAGGDITVNGGSAGVTAGSLTSGIVVTDTAGAAGQSLTFNSSSGAAVSIPGTVSSIGMESFIVATGTVKLAPLPGGAANGTTSFVGAGAAGDPAMGPVSATDLINGLTPTGTSANAGVEGSATIAALTDGLPPILPPAATGGAVRATVYTVGNGTFLTYTLNTTVNTNGYSLSGINVFSGWPDSGRSQITLTNISYSTVADPNTFIAIPNSAVNYPTSVAATGYEVLYTAAGGPIAANVAKVQFNFGTQQNGYVGYGELDVIGVPTPVAQDFTETDVTVAAGATLDTNGNSRSLKSLSGGGTVVNNLAATTSRLSVDSGAFSGVIQSGAAGALALTKTSAGTLILGNANPTYGDTLTIGAGTVQLGDGAVALASLPTRPIVDNGTLIVNNPSGTLTFAPVISGTGALTVQGAGTLKLAAGPIFAGTTTFSGAGAAGGPAVGPVAATDLINGLTPSAFTNGSPGAEGSGGVEVLTDGLASLFVSPGSDISTIYTMGNNGSLTYDLDIAAKPAGYDITNINIFASWRDNGRTQINLTNVSYSTVADPLTFIPIAGSTAAFPATAAATTASTISNYELLYAASNGIIATGVASIQFNFGTQQNGFVGYGELDVIGVPTGSVPYTFVALPNVTVAAGSTIDTNGTTVGMLSLAGAGTVTNNLAGSASALSVGANNSTFSGAIQNGAGTISSLNKTGAGTLVLNNPTPTTVPLSIAAGTLQFGDGTATGSITSLPPSLTSGTFVVNGTLALNNLSGALTLPANITGAGGLSILGGQTVTVTGANTYTGPTLIGAPIGTASFTGAGAAGDPAMGPVSATDLIHGLTPTGTSANAGAEGTATIAALTDGLPPILPPAATGAAVRATVYAVGNNTVLTYSLDTSVNTSGYSISNINIFSGWPDNGRSRITLASISYSTVADPDTFITIPGTAANYPTTAANGHEVLYTAAGGAIADYVSKIRFNFGTQQNGYVGYGELDVIGVPTTATVTTVNAGGTSLGAGTVTLGNPVSVLNANSTNLTLGGLAGNGIVHTLATTNLTVGGNNASTTFFGVIDGSAALVKTGAGTLTLSGANTYAGATTINAGALVAGNNSATGANSAINVNNSGALGVTGGVTIPATKAVTVNGVGPAAGVIQNIAGNNTIAAAMNFVSHVTIGSAAGTLTLSGAITLPLVGDVIFTGAGNTVVSSVLASGAMPFTGTLNGLSQSWLHNPAPGGAYLDGGTLLTDTKEGSNVLLTALDFVSGALTTATRVPAFFNETFVKFLWRGQMQVTAAGDYRFGVGAPASAGVDNDLRIQLNTTSGNHSDANLTTVYSRDGAIASDIGATVTHLEPGTYDIVVSFSGAGLPNSVGIIYSTNGNAATPTYQVLNPANNATSTTKFTTAVTNLAPSNAVIKNGTGTATLSGANTYNGGTTINAGILAAGANTTVFGANPAIQVNGGSLGLAAAGGITIAAPYAITINGLGAGNNGAIQSLGGNNTVSAPITLGSSAAIGATAGLLTVSGTITLPPIADLTFAGNGNTDVLSSFGNPSGSTTVDGLLQSWIHNAGAFAYLTSGALLTAPKEGTNVRTTALDIAPGGFVAATGNPGFVETNEMFLWRSQMVVTAAGDYVFGVGTPAVYALDDRLRIQINPTNGDHNDANLVEVYSRNAVLAPPASDVGTTATHLDPGTYDLVISYGGAGVPNYVGVVYSPDGGATIKVVDPAANNNAGQTTKFRTTVTTANNVIKTGTGTVKLLGNNTYNGTTTINAGTLQFGDGVAPLTSLPTGPIVDNGTLLLNNASGVLTLTTPLTGTGNLSVQGAGTVKLASTGTQRGTTTFVGAGVAGGTAVGPVSATDLINGLLPSAVANPSPGQEGSGVVDVLTDGLASTFTSGTGDITTIYTMGNNGVLTYDLDLAANPGGYDISNINVFASWRDTGRAQISLANVSYSTVAAPNTFIPVPGTAATFPGTVAASNYEVLYSANNGVIATGVAKIQFNFGTQQNAYVGYGELDVIGVPTVPKPNLVDYPGIAVTVGAGATLDINNNTVVTRTLSVAGGTLTGAGTVGAFTVTAGGSVAPGAGVGTLNTGNIALASGTSLKTELGGLTAGTQYDQVSATGTVNLNSNTGAGATLNVTLVNGFTPAVGNQFTIIANDGADAVTGTFAGLAEGATLSVGANNFTISYTGGDGNDVVLTAAAASTATTTTLQANPQATTGGTLVTFTTTIAPSPGAAGTVTFLDNGVAIPGGSNVAVSGGQAIFSTNTLAVGVHPVTAAYSGGGGFAPSTSVPVDVTITSGATPPSVTSFTINGTAPGFGGAQRSRVVDLTIVFDQAVQLDADAVTLALHPNVDFGGPQPGGVGALPTLNVTASSDNKTFTVTFSGANTVVDPGADGFQSLKDGVYDYTIVASKVHPLGTPGVSMAANSTGTFHRLFGDINPPTQTGNSLSAVVNTGDNLQFRNAFNKPVGGGYLPYFDVNGDGTINSGDNLQFRNRFNKTLAWTV